MIPELDVEHRRLESDSPPDRNRPMQHAGETLMRYIGKPFKTFAGALKRAQFENAHQQHLTRRYVHRVEKIGDTYRVVRERKETR